MNCGTCTTARWRRGVVRTGLLDYAAKLTREPRAMREDDVTRLREQGFEDRDILHINMIAGYYAFVNRLTDGLGVELETMWDEQEG